MLRICDENRNPLRLVVFTGQNLKRLEPGAVKWRADEGSFGVQTIDSAVFTQLMLIFDTMMA